MIKLIVFAPDGTALQECMMEPSSALKKLDDGVLLLLTEEVVGDAILSVDPAVFQASKRTTRKALEEAAEKARNPKARHELKAYSQALEASRKAFVRNKRQSPGEWLAAKTGDTSFMPVQTKRPAG